MITNRYYGCVRRPVQREGAESYLLVSFFEQFSTIISASVQFAPLVAILRFQRRWFGVGESEIRGVLHEAT